MNIAKRLSGLVSIGAALFLLAGAQGCDGDAQCTGVACGAGGGGGEGGGGTTTSTESTTGTETSTGTSTETSTETSTGSTTSSGTTTTQPDPASPESVCQKLCDCTPDACGPSGDDITDCVDSFGELLADAQAAGCVPQLDQVVACYDEELMCVNGEPQIQACLPVLEQFEICMDSAPDPDPTPCNEIVDKILLKYDACGIDVEPNPDPPPPCTDETLMQLQCFEPCILGAPCGVFDGTATNAQIEAYFECTEGCQ